MKAYESSILEDSTLGLVNWQSMYQIARCRNFGIAMLLGSIVLITGCQPTVETVETTSDQNKLAKIAYNSNDKAVQEAAIRKLTNPKLLTDIAIHSSEIDPQARRLALELVLLNAGGEWVRMRGIIDKLTEENEIGKVAMEAKSLWVRRAAVKLLNHQTQLVKIATENPDAATRKLAVERITEEALLVKIAMDDKDWWVRKTAVGGLNDPDPNGTALRGFPDEK